MDNQRPSVAEQSEWQRILRWSRMKEIEFFLTEGNHDIDYLGSGLDMGEIRLSEDLTFEVNEKKFYVAHGHLFDDNLQKKDERHIPLLVWLYPLARRWPWFYKTCVYEGRVPFFGWIFPKINGIWKRRCERISRAGLKLGEEKGMDVVIFSHTHRPLLRKNGGVVYYNTGCACAGSENNTILTIDHDGKVEVHKFSVDGEYLGVLDLVA